jgi:hypothetical protein
MTSALGDNFANATNDGKDGVSELTVMLAVEVGERCKVKGCPCAGLLAAGFGSARIWERKLTSRKVA